jgi:hypothetical protein
MDNDIKADIATKASSEIGFAGVDYTVSEGVVNLNGYCPTIKEKTKVEETVKDIAGVKKVINNIELGPVLLNSDRTLKMAADSAIKNYAMARVTVSDSIITVKGNVSQKDVQKILTSLDSLHPKGIVRTGIVGDEPPPPEED